MKEWMSAKGFRITEHLPYSSDLALKDFFLFPPIKKQLAAKTLTQESFKSTLEGAARSITKEDFATAFWHSTSNMRSFCVLGADTSRNFGKKLYLSSFLMFSGN